MSVLSRFGSNSTSDLTGVRRFGHLDSNCGSSKDIYIGDRHHQILKTIYISLSNSDRYIYILLYIYKGLGSQGRSPHDVSYPCLSGSFRRRTRGPSWVAFDEFGNCLSSASVRALPPGEPLLAGLGLHADHCVVCSDPSDPGQLRLHCEDGRGGKGPKQESFGICTNQASGPFLLLH